MFIRRTRLLGLTAILSLGAIIGVDTWARAPAPVYRERSTRTYRFTARIKSNDGVTPFKVADLIKGTFTYDLRGKNMRPDIASLGRYRSKRNSITFQLGDLRFTGTGEVLASVSYRGDEHFAVGSSDLDLPKGWQMDHSGPSQTYTFLLQNAPTRQVIRSIEMPERLSLADFVNTHELRLDFFNGVTFPGGRVKGRATVFANVESLD
jgi:hypothetical protein